MIKSMTGFGISKRKSSIFELTVEAKSLNHRFFDLKMKQVKEFFTADIEVRQVIQKKIKRGKVEIYFNLEYINDGETNFTINKKRLNDINLLFNEISNTVGSDLIVTVSDFLRFKDYFLSDEIQWGEEEKRIFLEAVEEAIESLDKMRIKEGEYIKKLLIEYVNSLVSNLEEMKEKYDNEKERIRKKMKSKFLSLLGEEKLDNGRMEEELFFYLEKIDIEEELARLGSHLLQFKNISEQGGVVGRKLDFLAQEMLREVNTIASKSQNYSFIESVVGMKTDIEKIREQVQNIE